MSRFLVGGPLEFRSPKLGPLVGFIIRDTFFHSESLIAVSFLRYCHPYFCDGVDTGGGIAYSSRVGWNSYQYRLEFLPILIGILTNIELEFLPI